MSKLPPDQRALSGRTVIDSKPAPAKKRKQHAVEEEAPAVSAPEISLRVACLDGNTMVVSVPQRGLVREVKLSVGQVRREPPFGRSPV
jgi:hypothetical protein